jgi:hypothetical protein
MILLMKSILIALKKIMINCFSKEILIFLLYMPLPHFNISVEFLGGFTMLKELKLPNQIGEKKNPFC